MVGSLRRLQLAKHESRRTRMRGAVQGRRRLALVLVGLLPVMCCMRNVTNGACNLGKIYSKAVTLLYDMPSKCHSDSAVGEICAGNLEMGRV